MSDIDAGKVGAEITSHDIKARKDAWTTLNNANPADIKDLAAKVTKSIDLHSLGLDGFHLDPQTPVGGLQVDASQTPDKKAHTLPVFEFTSDDGKKSVVLLPSGTEFDDSGKTVRNPDVTRPAKAADPAANPAAPADATNPNPAAKAEASLPVASANPAAPADATNPAAPKDATNPAAPTDATNPAAPKDATDTTSDADKAKVQQLIQKTIDDASISLPVKRGEGYYQVLKRMHPDMAPEDAVKQARHMRDLNGGNINLKVGDKLPMMSAAENKAQVQAQMDLFNKLPADQKAQAIAAARAAYPDAPAPAAPAPEAPAPAARAPEAPAPAAPAPEAPAPAAPAPEAPAPAALTDPSNPSGWAPSLDVNSKDLQPKPDPTNAGAFLYNPLAPIGLSEGTPGKPIDSKTAGVDERTITPGKDPKAGEQVNGKINDWSLFHLWDTKFTTNDVLKDGKIAGRVTQYDNDQVDMKFQGAAGQPPIKILAVKEVNTTIDNGHNGYTTTVTNYAGKSWTFKSDEKGVVTDTKAN